jgi:ketosteroid isomerase-like protein
MSSDNKQLLRRLYDAYNRGDFDTILANMTDDVTWYVPGPAPFAGHRTGRDQVREFFNESLGWVEVDQFDADEFLADGDRVVVLGRQRATVRETGRHFETQWAHVYTLRGDKIAVGQIFTDTHAIASALGESTREREALTGSLGVTHPAFSGRGTPE